MEHNGNLVGVLCGITGGMVKYLIDIDAAFWSKTLEALITAFLCGIVGALGNHLYKLIVKPKSK